LGIYSAFALSTPASQPDEMFCRHLSYQDESPSRIFKDDIEEGRLTMKVKSNVRAGGGLMGLLNGT
jgi:hypothetical protein